MNEIKDLGVICKAYKSNAASYDESQILVESILKDFETFDVLINNAGITRDNLLMRMSEDDFDKVIEINLKSVFNMVKACQRVFLKKHSGSIINISSIVGIKGNAGQSNYAASKAGVEGMTRSIALEVASRGITANCIAPGFIKTDMTKKLLELNEEKLLENIPIKRIGIPEDISSLTAFLASDNASYITGQTFHVNGGMMM